MISFKCISHFIWYIALPADDLLIKEAIALLTSPEDALSTEETTTSISTDTKSGEHLLWCHSLWFVILIREILESLLDALNSTSKRLTIAINSTTVGTNTDPPEPVSTTIPANQSLVQETNVTTKKKHIMISYNRSCEDGCRRLRNKLKVDHIIF